MKKGMWIYWGIVVVGLGILAYSLIPREPVRIDVSRLELSQLSELDPIAPSQIVTGALSVKYLTAEELERLNLEIDLDQAPHRADANLDQWAFALFADAIPAISQPQMTTIAETDTWLKPDDLVLSVTYNGITRAYPIRILDAHEIVNENFDDHPLLITYCPLCGSGIVFERPSMDGKPLEFGVSGRLYQANLLMYDRLTGTFWHQLTGEPFAGPLLGKAGSLKRIPADIVPWELWKTSYPNAQVLKRPTQVTTPRGTLQRTKGDYDRYRYEDYRLKQGVGFGVDINDLDLRGMSSKRKVVGIEIDNVSKAYVAFMLKDEGLINDTVGEQDVLIGVTFSGEIKAYYRKFNEETLTFQVKEGALIDEQTESTWNWQGQAISGPYAASKARLAEIPVTPAFWFAWVALHPHTELFAGT